MTYALSRMIYSLARDGLLPKTFKEVTKTSRVPKNATILTGLVSAIAAGIFPLSSIAAFLNICTLAYLILLAYGIIKLRKDKGEPKEGEFKTPLVPFLPILSILICLSFMLQYTLETWIAFVLALAVGVIIYFTYGYKNSTLSKINKEKSRFRRDFFIIFHLQIERSDSTILLRRRPFRHFIRNHFEAWFVRGNITLTN